MSNNNETQSSQDQMNQILGYGKELQVLVGKNEDGTPKLETFHFTPVSMQKIPRLSKMLDEYFATVGAKSFSEASLNKAAEIVKISLEKMHPEIEKKEILEKFTLGTLAKAIRIVLDVNDFLSEMQAIEEMAKINKQA